MPALVHSYLCESTAAECAIYMKFGIYYPYWEKEWGGDAIGYIERVKRLALTCWKWLQLTSLENLMTTLQRCVKRLNTMASCSRVVMDPA